MINVNEFIVDYIISGLTAHKLMSYDESASDGGDIFRKLREKHKTLNEKK